MKKAFFGPMRVSVMLDSNGSNTTAVAAVSRIQQAAGSIDGKRILVTAGSARWACAPRVCWRRLAPRSP